MKSLVPIHGIEHRILFMRGQRVMLDADLAVLYGVSTKRLNEQVHRNRERFPDDFMFQLNAGEVRSLRSQIATSKQGRGGRQYLPYVFTEHGVAMLSSVLRSPLAIRVNIGIMRAFVRLREVLATRQDLVGKIAKLERVVMKHDTGLRAVFAAIRRLMAPPRVKPRRIGFVGDR